MLSVTFIYLSLIHIFYSEEEILTLFDAVSGDPLELCVKIAAYYGLRRSEVLGLRWSAIDMEHKDVYKRQTAGSTLNPNAGTLVWVDNAGNVLPDTCLLYTSGFHSRQLIRIWTMSQMSLIMPIRFFLLKTNRSW